MKRVFPGRVFSREFLIASSRFGKEIIFLKPAYLSLRLISVSGDRLWDMSLRLKYAGFKKIISFPNLDDAIKNSLENTRPGNSLFILPNYSAMLETRKILTGKKIL